MFGLKLGGLEYKLLGLLLVVLFDLRGKLVLLVFRVVFEVGAFGDEPAAGVPLLVVVTGLYVLLFLEFAVLMGFEEYLLLVFIDIVNSRIRFFQLRVVFDIQLLLRLDWIVILRLDRFIVQFRLSELPLRGLRVLGRNQVLFWLLHRVVENYGLLFLVMVFNVFVDFSRWKRPLLLKVLHLNLNKNFISI